MTDEERTCIGARWQPLRCSVCERNPSHDGKMNEPLQCVVCLAIFCTDCFMAHQKAPRKEVEE